MIQMNYNVVTMDSIICSCSGAPPAPSAAAFTAFPAPVAAPCAPFAPPRGPQGPSLGALEQQQMVGFTGDFTMKNQKNMIKHMLYAD